MHILCNVGVDLEIVSRTSLDSLARDLGKRQESDGVAFRADSKTASPGLGEFGGRTFGYPGRQSLRSFALGYFRLAPPGRHMVSVSARQICADGRSEKIVSACDDLDRYLCGAANSS